MFSLFQTHDIDKVIQKITHNMRGVKSASMNCNNGQATICRESGYNAFYGLTHTEEVFLQKCRPVEKLSAAQFS